MQEIYLGIVEDADYGRGIAGAGCRFSFSALLFAWRSYRGFGAVSTPSIPFTPTFISTAGIFDVRDLKTAFAASLPFFGAISSGSRKSTGTCLKLPRPG